MKHQLSIMGDFMNILRVTIVLLLTDLTSAALVTDNLIIQLDASAITGLSDGDSLSSWADSAANDSVDGSVFVTGNYGSPTYESNEINGLPVVRFVRSRKDVMVSSGWTLPNPSGGLTIFIVCTGGSSGSVERVAQVGASAGTASHMLAVDVSESISGARYNNGYSLSFSGSNPIKAGVYHIGIRRMAQSGRHDSLYYAVNDLDVEPLSCNNPGTIITFDAGNNHLSLGNGVDPTGIMYPDFYNGDLAEILIYNSQLSTAQIIQTAGYLSQKYNLAFAAGSVLIDQSGGQTSVTEGGSSDDITVQLTGNPGASPVTIQIQDFLDPDQVYLTPSALVFTSANWQSPQQFQVTAVDDDFMERAVHDTQLELSVLTDPASPYYGLMINNIWVDIQDNDCGAWGFSPYDYNLDCIVNLSDLSILAFDWLQCSLPPDCQNYRP